MYRRPAGTHEDAPFPDLQPMRLAAIEERWSVRRLDDPPGRTGVGLNDFLLPAREISALMYRAFASSGKERLLR